MTDGGMGASATGGGSAAGGGSAGNTPMLQVGDTLADACIMYSYADCARHDTCSGSLPGSACLRTTFACPDVTNSDGATRELADLKTCAAVFAALACDELDSTPPACVTPGTLEVGSPCKFPSQCATLHCKLDASSNAPCGRCASSIAEGKSCGGSTEECAFGLFCDVTTCRRSLSSAAGLDEACSPGGLCQPDLYCVNDKCVAAPAVGEPCELPTKKCNSKGYCAGAAGGTVGTCQALPSAGMACAVDISSPNRGLCAAGATCNWDDVNKSGTCVGPQQPGDPCIKNDIGNYSCVGPQLYCDRKATPRVCRELNAPGGGCESDFACDATSVCECPDATTCTSKICRKLQFGHQPCTDPNTMCHPAFTCESGLCEPRGLQGLAQECK
jgi:hypothetical protein